MAIRHHLDYGSGGSQARRGPLFFRLPELLFLGALGLFLFTTQLRPTHHGGQQERPVTPAQLVASPPAATNQNQQQQHSSSSSSSQTATDAEMERLQGRVAALEVERDALRSELDRATKEGQQRGEEARVWQAERKAMAAQIAELESAIREDQQWAKRPGLAFDRQPPLRMPGWTLDHRFYALGAVLTRDQVDAPQLYLDLVLMGAKTFHKTSSSVLGVNDLDGEWAMGEAYNTKDASEIVKAGGRFLCRLRADADPIPAPIVPVHTSLDPNVNGIVEIVRCPVPDGGRDGVLDVVFLLQDAPVVPQPASGGDGKQQQGQKGQGQKGQSPEPYDLVRVNVPRATRTAGYFNYTLDATRLDPWQAEPDRLHLCIPGVTWRYTCPVLDLVLEFTEYHLQNGVDHIHFAMDFPYGSDDMDVAFETLRPYIDEGKVSVMSTQTVHGPGWIGSDHPKLWHINSCLAYTKGLATWVGVWDLDEFFVPHAKDRNIIETVEDLVEESGRKGPEDTCYIRLTSFNHVGQTADTNRTWVGQMFAKGRESVSDQTWQKVVVSARNTYFAGFHLPGACRRAGRDWAEQIPWDEAIHVDETVAAMHHYRNKFIHAEHIASNVTAVDEYARDRFPAVLAKLKERRMGEVVAKHCGYAPSMDL